MNFDQALAYLLSLGHETLTIKLGLKNTETLLAALGNPERSFPSIQIAGTNGKGSTAAFLNSICRAAGIRVGLFTSPHLISITERIQVDGKPISETQFAQLTGMVKAVAEQLVARGELQTPPTFFEHVTATALLAFARDHAEPAILETGLGGRLDSTTAAQAGIVAITSIAMDHQEYLGNTLAEIAAEKAAIIRPGVTAVIAPQDRPAFDVITGRCQAVRVRPLVINPPVERANLQPDTAGVFSQINGRTADGRYVVTFQSQRGTYPNITLALRGRHQITNAATAVAIAEALIDTGFHISADALVGGLETANHPGRLEIWEVSPRFLFDGAHNPAAAIALRKYLDEFINEPVVMIFGAMRDKALNEMMSALFRRSDQLILTTLDNPRAASIDELMSAVPSGLAKPDILAAANVSEALELARRITAPNGIVCVTGSLHLIGKAQELLRATGR